jgi:hypothetical protein
MASPGGPGDGGQNVSSQHRRHDGLRRRQGGSGSVTITDKPDDGFQLAEVVACCISWSKSLGRTSQTCSTVEYPAASSCTAIHSAQERLTAV